MSESDRVAHGDLRNQNRQLSIHARVLEALLHLERHVHEAGLGLSFKSLKSRHPELTFVQAILDGYRSDLSLERRDHPLHPAGRLVVRIVLVRKCPNIHRLGQAIHGAYKTRAAYIEPEGAERYVPARGAGPDEQLPELDCFSTG